jgi:hypothetical protein
MISRRTTHLVQMLYDLIFTEDIGFGPVLDKEKLYDFLYENDHEVWFLDLYKRQVKNEVDLKSLILNLHTGMAYTSRSQTLKDKQELGQQVIKHLAISILKMLDSDFMSWTTADKKSDNDMLAQDLINRLELDGYKYKDGKLFPLESTVIPEEQEQSYLEDLIQDLNLSDQNTIKHHLKLSEEHFLNAKYDDSISNSRKVLDAILSQVASAAYLKVNGTPIPQPMLRNATDIRGFLERQNIVTRVERAALDQNYSALSATGGHPYIAEKDQARLMRHLALTFSQFVLLRYEGFVRNNP